MQNLYKDLEKLLLTVDDFKSEDGRILKNKVAEAAISNDATLLGKLLQNSKLKKHFFTEIETALVFNKDKFIQFTSSKEFLPDSFTAFKNKIGLHDGESYLLSADKVSLVWPYKDCVLEGGQDKEDQKRAEIFYNETLAPDEIDRLFEKKVLTNFAKFSKKGEEKVDNVTIDDNLIIKGNNLLALHSLKDKYAGQVKLVYIDPPYYFAKNKKEDTFEYNSNFKLSTWLTFMKNRLEVAKDLLREDGSIFVQISDDGVGYLHTLLHEVFNTDGNNNFINKITVKTKSPSGFASVNAGVFETAEYILVYAKNKKSWSFNEQFVKSEYDSNYKWFIPNKEEDYQRWEIEDLAEFVAKSNGFQDKKKAVKELGENAFTEMVADFSLENSEKIYQSTAIADNASSEVVKTRDLSKNSEGKIFEVKRDGGYDVYIYNGREMAFYSKKIREIEGEQVPSIQLSNIWTDVPYEGIASEGKVKLKGGKKPEKLLKRIIELASNEGDIVLDYHLGSGTTAAVCHKLKRKYIGLEQIESQVEKSLNRLELIIGGDTSGVSKVLKWKGGGSFIYAELKEHNQSFIDEIEDATTSKKLLSIYEKMKKEAFFKYEVDLSKFDGKDFAKLNLDEQKQALIECLDKNHLYVNYNDIDDTTFKVSAEDKKLNKLFYSS